MPLQAHWLPTSGWKVKEKTEPTATELELGDVLKFACGHPGTLKRTRVTTSDWSTDCRYQPDDSIELSHQGTGYLITRKLVHRLIIEEEGSSVWIAEEG